jgi:hypothetical protein
MDGWRRKREAVVVKEDGGKGFKGNACVRCRRKREGVP